MNPLSAKLSTSVFVPYQGSLWTSSFTSCLSSHFQIQRTAVFHLPLHLVLAPCCFVPCTCSRQRGEELHSISSPCIKICAWEAAGALPAWRRDLHGWKQRIPIPLSPGGVVSEVAGSGEGAAFLNLAVKLVE